MIINFLASYIANHVSLDSMKLARILYYGTLVSCNQVQLFGLTTANELAPALNVSTFELLCVYYVCDGLYSGWQTCSL